MSPATALKWWRVPERFRKTNPRPGRRCRLFVSSIQVEAHPFRAAHSCQSPPKHPIPPSRRRNSGSKQAHRVRRPTRKVEKKKQRKKEPAPTRSFAARARKNSKPSVNANVNAARLSLCEPTKKEESSDPKASRATPQLPLYVCMYTLTSPPFPFSPFFSLSSPLTTHRALAGSREHGVGGGADWLGGGVRQRWDPCGCGGR